MAEGQRSNEKAEDERLEHLGWTSKQGSILTGGGRAEELYTADRGFPYTPEELPHYHLMQGNTHEVFKEWRSLKGTCSLIVGAWNRPLFTGGWEHSSDKDERVFNVQASNLFVDLRIPVLRDEYFSSKPYSSLEELSPQELRLYARQHVFAGFSDFSMEQGKPLCARHHCIDWNFVGTPRTRPNKWWIKMNENNNVWKENSYATDEDGQHYYFERWERYANGSKPPRVAFRKAAEHKRDGVFVIVGDHFNYVLSRELSGNEDTFDKKTLVDLVDAAVAADDLATARAYLSTEAGHGTISSGWLLDAAIPFWNEKSALLNPTEIAVDGDSLETCQLVWKGEKWDLMDCGFSSVEELCHFFKPP